MRSTGSPYVDKGSVRAFFKKTLVKKAGELLSMSRNQLRIMTGLLKGHCHLKARLFKIGLVYSPECDRYKKASKMASHVLCDCVELATLRFRHVGHHL
jgi:hypothetical protein